MISGFCASGSTAVVHSWDEGLNPTWSNFFIQLINTHYIVKVTNTELWDIYWLMGYRNAHTDILNTCIGFRARNTAKQAVAHHTFMSS